MTTEHGDSSASDKKLDFRAEMEPPNAVAAPDFRSVVRSITKILCLRHPTISSSGGAAAYCDYKDNGASRKLKLSEELGEWDDFSVISSPQDEKDTSWTDAEAAESLLANLFSSISAVKAAYAQLQVAQSPYDPDLIQRADAAIVAELRRLSELKRIYFVNQCESSPSSISLPILAARLEELRNLIRTYKITFHKLENELELKDSEVHATRGRLLDSDSKTRALEANLHPNSFLAALDALHLSGLNPTHFLTALRYAYKSIRLFVNLMGREMESAGWDLDAAAGTIQPDVVRQSVSSHRTFAYESYVCLHMFSNFHRERFGLSAFNDLPAWDRRKFFDEFARLRSIAINQSAGFPTSIVAQFCAAKYLSLVHPKMETSFFGDLRQRAVVSSGQGFPESEFFKAFSEMARRVWLLHCLFFAFDPDSERSIFQVRRGSRFSQVFMESVMSVEADRGESRGRDLVGFTVVPGFKVGGTVIQCKVYLIPPEAIVHGPT